MEEGLFLRMMTVSPGPGRIPAAGARHVARQLREIVWEDHEAALARIGVDRSCPFDLNALVPVPWEVLRLGEDDPAAVAWLWAHWGTTWPLRRVEMVALPPARRRALPPGHAGGVLRFWSADWSPWPAILACRTRWPELRFELAVEYWWDVAATAAGAGKGGGNTKGGARWTPPRGSSEGRDRPPAVRPSGGGGGAEGPGRPGPYR